MNGVPQYYRVPIVVTTSFKKYPTKNSSDDEEDDGSPSTSSPPAMVITRKNSTLIDRDLDDHEYRVFEPSRQPDEEQEDIQELHERTMNRHAQDPITNKNMQVVATDHN